MKRDSRDDEIFPLVRDGDSTNMVPADTSDDVSNDAMQLIAVAVFNGLCRVISALAENGSLNKIQIEGIHDAMTTPLDDPQLRDDDTVSSVRGTLEKILAQAMTIAIR